jgi:histidine triad (HIT) family protein
MNDALEPARPDDECPFCRITRGDDDSLELICQGPSWVAFFPPEPATLGHTLVIPREHVPDFWSLPLPLAADLSEITSSGRAAEQTVFHVHLHVVPRWSEDGFGRIWPPERTMDRAVKQDVAARVRDACHAVRL